MGLSPDDPSSASCCESSRRRDALGLGHLREPDLIIGSWCGKKFRPERVMSRPGFDRTPAVQHQDLYEIKSSLILQPGPAALTDGLAEIQNIVERWAVRTRETSSMGARLLD